MPDNSEENKGSTLVDKLIPWAAAGVLVLGIGTCDYLATRSHEIGQRGQCRVTTHASFERNGGEMYDGPMVLDERCPDHRLNCIFRGYDNDLMSHKVYDKNGQQITDESSESAAEYAQQCSELFEWVKMRP